MFASERTVYAVGATKADAGAVLWKLDLPDRAGPATVADVVGDGLARIVVACADDYAYGIGPGRSGAASESARGGDLAGAAIVIRGPHLSLLVGDFTAWE